MGKTIYFVKWNYKCRQNRNSRELSHQGIERIASVSADLKEELSSRLTDDQEIEIYHRDDCLNQHAAQVVAATLRPRRTRLEPRTLPQDVRSVARLVDEVDTLGIIVGFEWNIDSYLRRRGLPTGGVLRYYKLETN